MTSLRHNHAGPAREPARRLPRRRPRLHPRRRLAAYDAHRGGPPGRRLPDDDLPRLAGHAELLGDLMTREWSGRRRRPRSPTGHRRPTRVDAASADGRSSRTVARAARQRAVPADRRGRPRAAAALPARRRGRSQDADPRPAHRAAIRAGQAAGAIRAGNPTASPAALLLAAHGFVLSAHTMADDAVTEAELDAELRLLVTRTRDASRR